MEDLVPLLGPDPSSMSQGPDNAPKAVVGTRRSAAYRINQYLFEHSRH